MIHPTLSHALGFHKSIPKGIPCGSLLKPIHSSGSLSQTSWILKTVNTGAVSVAPSWLHSIAAHDAETDKNKALLRISQMRTRDVAQHVRLATARRAWTRATEKLQIEIRFRPVVPVNRKFTSDLLNIGWFQTHWFPILAKYRPQEQARWIDRSAGRCQINAASPPASGMQLGDLDPPIRALGVGARQKSPCRRAPASRLPRSRQ